MDLLPEELVELIALYLSATDLARCCTVNHSWREIFGKDYLWQTHCIPSIADHLVTTGSEVSPHFTTPESDGSTLGPIGEWQLNYMRQIHLWNNWKSGNFIKKKAHLTKEAIANSGYASKRLFYKDNYLLEFKDLKLKIWDVRTSPVLCFEAPIQAQPKLGIEVFEVYGCDKFVVIHGLVVQVYSLNISTKVLQRVHLFSLQTTKRCDDISTEFVQDILQKQGKYVLTSCTIVKNILLGIVMREQPLKLHIWNVETGNKLKEEICPFDKRDNRFIRSCEKTMNILIDLEERTNEGRYAHFYVYNLNKLSFLPFHVTYKVGKFFFKTDYYCIMFNNCVAIRAKNTLYVHNYYTSELLYSSSINGTILHLQNTVVFKQGEFMIVVDPYKKVIQAQFDKKLFERKLTSIVSDTAIGIRDIVNDVDVMLHASHLNEGVDMKRILLYQFSSTKDLIANKYGTKVVLMSRKHLHVVHFW